VPKRSSPIEPGGDLRTKVRLTTLDFGGNFKFPILIDLTLPDDKLYLVSYDSKGEILSKVEVRIAEHLQTEAKALEKRLQAKPVAEARPRDGTYRCQFCLKDTPINKWKAGGDTCPECGKKYDYMLAQEGDD